ncbi:hypothetical protein BX666DRAFT_2019503 [Dichotomocladium elegans]|nr:hypothetical protein BX666DRAFT_2019503 [Dichotomocladium elegans]
MSFASGAECGPTNPMAGLIKQFYQDRSLQQSAGFRSRSQQTMPLDRQFTDEFLRDERIERPANAFEFQGLSRELASIHRPQADWASDFAQHHVPEDRKQFEEFEKIYQQNRVPAHQWRNDFAAYEPQQLHSTLSHTEHQAFEAAFEEAKQSAEMKWDQEFAEQESKDWVGEFEKQQETRADCDQEAMARTAGMLLETVDADNNPKFKNSKFMSLMRDLRDRKVRVEGSGLAPTDESSWATEFRRENQAGSSAWVNDFVKQAGPPQSGNMWSTEFAQKSERGWTESFDQQQQRQSTDNPLDDWVKQYKNNIAHLYNAQDEAWDGMQKDWERIQTDQIGGYRAANREYQQYNYAADNPYLVNPAALAQPHQSTLAQTILTLEAKTQLNPSDAGSWQELGLRQQENERDGAAIAALSRAVNLNPSMLDSWLGLAVSYTNENCRLEALEALEQWIQNNPKYKHLATDERSLLKHNRHGYVTNLFLDAARSQAELDAEVQVGLGILFNVSEEYSKAIDCFKAALQSRPHDYLLWNKLGATLANSRDTAGAIDAYFNALEINPSYVRARYNLAVSCINLGQHREAAEHLLTCLAIQQTNDTQQPQLMVDEQGKRVPIQSGMGDNVWDSLRLLMIKMNRQDLAEQCDKRSLDSFHGEFEF